MSLKHGVRRWIDRAAMWTGVVAGMERRRGRGLSVLMYHRVLERERCRDLPFPSLVMPRDAFEAEVRSLAARCTVLPLGPALARLSNGPMPERPLVALTFDDGYGDNHSVAAPVLEAAGLRATFYVTTGFVSSGELLWFDRAALALASADTGRKARFAELASASPGPRPAPDADDADWIEWLKRVPRGQRRACLDVLDGGARSPRAAEFAPMTSAQVAELARRGHEIGSHTVDHELLPGLEEPELARQLAESRAVLEGWTGAPVRAFCYPNGDHDEHSERAVRAAGYAHACTTGPGLHVAGGDPLRIGRTDVTPMRVCGANGRHDEPSFRAELCGLHEHLR